MCPCRCREFEPRFLSRRRAAGLQQSDAGTSTGATLSFEPSRRIGGIALAHSVSTLVLIAFGTACIAAPAITGVAGSMADGQTVTISGSGFGNGPTVLVFDDFESGDGQPGQSIPLTSPEVGKWSDYTAQGRPTYSAARSLGEAWFPHNRLVPAWVPSLKSCPRRPPNFSSLTVSLCLRALPSQAQALPGRCRSS